MPKPEVVRRVKTYSAATGFVYQYQFQNVHPVRGGAAGNEYIYYVSADRKTMHPLRILVRADALADFANRTGRRLNGTEEYAVAKMRLFRAFDEVEDLAAEGADLAVDASNLEELLSALDL